MSVLAPQLETLTLNANCTNVFRHPKATGWISIKYRSGFCPSHSGRYVRSKQVGVLHLRAVGTLCHRACGNIESVSDLISSIAEQIGRGVNQDMKFNCPNAAPDTSHKHFHFLIMRLSNKS